MVIFKFRGLQNSLLVAKNSGYFVNIINHLVLKIRAGQPLLACCSPCPGDMISRPSAVNQ